MRRITLFLLALFLAAATLPQPSHAQAATTSLLDPSRLSVGLRAYRSFDEKVGVAGSYTSGWWIGVPAAWELTSPHDPTVKLPVSIIASLDLGMPDKRVRGYVGLAFLLKRSGQ